MTADASERMHDEIAELLPDFILGALSEADQRRVTEHLAGCARCRAEFDAALETSSVLFDAGPVAPAVREELLARLSPVIATPVWPVPLAPLGDVPPTSATPTDPIRATRRPTRLDGRARRIVTVAAAVILILGGVAAVNRLNDDDRGEDGRIAELRGNPAFAHPLTDRESGSTAEGMIYVDPGDDQAYVEVGGLAPAGEGLGYQVWLFMESGQQVSAGFLAVDDDGSGRALITAPEAFAAYWAVGLSAEPIAGSQEPTAPLALGGWIQ